MTTFKTILGEHPFFKGFDDPYLELIAECASNVRFDAGQYIFREGEAAMQFWLIRHGKVALEIYAPERGPIVVETLRAGEILGWSWIVPPHLRHFDARAVEQTRAVALDGECLRKKLEEDPKLGYDLLKRFAYVLEQRLHTLHVQLLDIYAARP